MKNHFNKTYAILFFFLTDRKLNYFSLSFTFQQFSFIQSLTLSFPSLSLISRTSFLLFFYPNSQISLIFFSFVFISHRYFNRFISKNILQFIHRLGYLIKIIIIISYFQNMFSLMTKTT